MTRIIIIGAILILAIFVFRFFKLISKYKSGSRPNINDLKDRAENLKKKYKNVEEAEYRDIPPTNDESESSKKDNG